MAVTPEDKASEESETYETTKETSGSDEDKMRVLAEDDTVRTRSLENEENKQVIVYDFPFITNPGTTSSS